MDNELLEDEHMDTQSDPQFEQLKRRALWILKLKEKRKLTQSTLEEILQDVTELCTDLVAELGKHVASTLLSAGVKAEEVPGLLELFDEKSECCQPFHHLNTYHRQLSFYRANFNFVDPVQLSLGSRHVIRGTGSDHRVIEKKDTFVYVPLLKSIESLLKDRDVLEEVMTSHQRTDGIQEDYCDSVHFRENPLFSVDCNSLQLMLYYDDVEFCNPLGSKRKKHKLGCFYFTLGNLHPKHRSSLNSIQLLALVKVDLLNIYGMDKVLEPIVEDLQKLEKGVMFQSASGQLALRGTVTTVSADNLGNHAIGGFKEGGQALRCCRHCMVPTDDMGSKLIEDQVILRTPDDHQHHCQLLEGPMCDFFSTNYGVTRNSLLNSLDFYHVCSSGLPPDIMHDILEGYLPYTVKLMLNNFIANAYLSLEQLNQMIENFDYGYSDSCNKPSPISHTTLTSHETSGLAQSATQMWCLGRFLPLMYIISIFSIAWTIFITSIIQNINATQMWCLGRFLPLMIGHFVPEENSNWSHFLQLLDIMELVFAPRVHPDTPPYLQFLIAENLEKFKVLYPTSSFKPKMHYLTHIPRYLERVGPLIRHWTMRYEAKHQYFKHLASTMGNYINICYSLAMRHQCLQCYLHASGAVVHTDDQEVGNGSTITLQESEFCSELQEQFGGPPDSRIFRTSSVRVHRMELKSGVVIVMGMDKDDTPEFMLIQELFVDPQNRVVLGTKSTQVVEYDAHFHSWVIQVTTQKQLVPAVNIFSRQILTPRNMRNAPISHQYLTLKFSV